MAEVAETEEWKSYIESLEPVLALFIALEKL